MPDAVRITDIRLVSRSPRAEVALARGHSVLVATFDCIIGPIQLLGCSLRHAADGRFKANGPRISRRDEEVRAAYVTDNALRAELLDKALGAFRAIGGGAERTAAIDDTRPPTPDA